MPVAAYVALARRLTALASSCSSPGEALQAAKAVALLSTPLLFAAAVAAALAVGLSG